MADVIDWNEEWTKRIVPQKDGGYAIDASMDALIFRRTLGIPKLMETKELANWDTCGANALRWQIIADVDQYVASYRHPEHRHSLILAGGTGAGKTHLGIGVIKAMCAHRIRPKFVDYRLLLEELRSNFGDEGIGEWIEADALMIDDFGAADATKIQLSRMSTIFSGRMANGRPTVITSNAAWPGGFERLLDDRIISRMHEGFKVVQMNLPDWRRTDAA